MTVSALRLTPLYSRSQYEGVDGHDCAVLGFVRWRFVNSIRPTIEGRRIATAVVVMRLCVCKAPQCQGGNLRPFGKAFLIDVRDKRAAVARNVRAADQGQSDANRSAGQKRFSRRPFTPESVRDRAIADGQ